MAELKKYTRAEALEICKRMGLSEMPLSNETVLIGTNDKGHLYKFPIKTKEDILKEAETVSKQTKVDEPIKENTAEQTVIEPKKEEVVPVPPVKRKRGRPPKKKKAE